ncbi:hypothetical protein NNG48_07100 [Enterococcus faecium]|nr:hypothetical protein [Enterococcus faecium]
MFTLFLEFRKDCVLGFEELEVDSAQKVLNVITQSVNADVCETIDYGNGYVKAKVFIRATDIVEFLVAREGLEMNMNGRNYKGVVKGIEIIDADETITPELLMEGKAERKKIKFPRVKYLVNKLLKKG